MNIKMVPAVLTVAALTGLPGLVAADPAKSTVNPAELADTTRYGYSLGTVAAPGSRTIFVAGQVGVSDQGPNDFESQVDRAFANMLAVLKAAGGRAEDVVKITVLIKDHDDERLQYLVRKRREIFGNAPPASTLIPVEKLALPSFEFEIDAVAVAPR